MQIVLCELNLGMVDPDLAKQQLLLLMRDLWRILSGRLADDELVMIKGSEEKP